MTSWTRLSSHADLPGFLSCPLVQQRLEEKADWPRLASSPRAGEHRCRPRRLQSRRARRAGETERPRCPPPAPPGRRPAAASPAGKPGPARGSAGRRGPAGGSAERGVGGGGAGRGWVCSRLTRPGRPARGPPPPHARRAPAGPCLALSAPGRTGSPLGGSATEPSGRAQEEGLPRRCRRHPDRPASSSSSSQPPARPAGTRRARGGEASAQSWRAPPRPPRPPPCRPRRWCRSAWRTAATR